MERKFKIYSVCDIDTGRPLTIVRSKKQVNDYIDKFVKAKNYQHYSMWCNLRELNPEEDTSWRMYVQNCKPEAKFIVKVGKVPFSALMGSFRTACGCLPLGMPWELDAEMEAYTNSLPKEVKGAISELEKLDTSNMSQSDIDNFVKDVENKLKQKDAE